MDRISSKNTCCINDVESILSLLEQQCYLAATGERVVVITWKGSYGPTFYWPGNYPVPNDNECQIVLFQNGSVLLQYKKLTCPPWWWLYDDYDIGITDGNGQYEQYMPDAGPCNFGSDGNVMFVPVVIPENQVFHNLSCRRY